MLAPAEMVTSSLKELMLLTTWLEAMLIAVMLLLAKWLAHNRPPRCVGRA